MPMISVFIYSSHSVNCRLSVTYIGRLSPLEAFPRRLHGVLKFTRAPRELNGILYVYVYVKTASNGVLTESSPRPHRVKGVGTEFTLRSTALLGSSYGAPKTFPRRSMEFPLRCYGASGVCTALTSAFCIFL